MQGGDSLQTSASGLPNITGSGIWNRGTDISSLASGAIYTVQSGAYGGTTQTAIKEVSNAFDASHSNPIYGASDNVQPPTIYNILQFKF